MITYDDIQVPSDVLQALVDMADELAAFRDLSPYREALLKKGEALLKDYHDGTLQRAEQAARAAEEKAKQERLAKELAESQPAHWGTWA